LNYDSHFNYLSNTIFPRKNKWYSGQNHPLQPKDSRFNPSLKFFLFSMKENDETIKLSNNFFKLDALRKNKLSLRRRRLITFSLREEGSWRKK